MRISELWNVVHFFYGVAQCLGGGFYFFPLSCYSFLGWLVKTDRSVCSTVCAGYPEVVFHALVVRRL